MNKRPKPSRKRGASVGIAICFAAAVAIVGTYTLKSYQESDRQEASTMDETNGDKNKTKVQTKSANTDRLVISTKDDEKEKETEEVKEEIGEGSADEAQDVPLNTTETAGSGTALNFTESSQLLWPVNGQILLNFSMDKTVYFSTLDQYKYNPALIISGAEGDQVISGAAGVVKSIDVSAQTGTTVNLDLGNGYELFVGQLKEVPVNTGDYVNANTVIGYVSQPTKYYSVEGCNVYYEMRKDGQPIDPLQFVDE